MSVAVHAETPSNRQPQDNCGISVQEAAAKFGWDLEQSPDWAGDKRVRELPVAAIRRPLQKLRSNSEFFFMHTCGSSTQP